MDTLIEEPARRTPVKRAKYDVVVAGAGPAGLIAAITAARMGSKTLLVERLGFLGGNLTGAGVLNIRTFNDGANQFVIGGVPLEFAQRLQERGMTVGDPRTAPYLRHSLESTKLVAQEMALESGVEMLLHSLIVDVVKSGNAVEGIIIENKSGREAILGSAVVDATGDGDVFARAGAAFEKRERGEIMPLTLTFIVGGLPTPDWPNLITPERYKAVSEAIKKHGSPTPLPGAGIFPLAEPGFAYVNGTRCFADCSDTDDVTKAELEGRRQVHALVAFWREHMPGFRDCYVVSTPAVIGTRESRRVRGLYALSRDDVLAGREFDDRVARGAYKIDVHSGSDGSTRYEDPGSGVSYAIPYRCLIPEKLDGVVVAGRCISVEPQALGSTRAMATCMATGQAAGAAAVLAVREERRLRKLEVGRLQDELRRQGAVLDRPQE